MAPHPLLPLARNPHPFLPVESYLVRIDVPGATLEGHLEMAAEPRGIVLFAHDGGSGLHSARNQLVARALRENVSVGTLLIDLASPAEGTLDETRSATLRSDITLLASRMIAICDWLEQGSRTRGLPLALFAASTESAASLIAAAERPDDVAAIVSGGGRPDLAEDVLRRVRAPTLLLVGGDDPAVLDFTRRAARALTCVHEVSVIPGVSHLFAEHDRLVEVSRRAAAWFARHLPEVDSSDEPFS